MIVLTMKNTKTMLIMKMTKTMLTMKVRKTMLTKRIILLLIINRNDNSQTSLKRPPPSQLVKPSSVTSSRYCITGEEKMHISCVSECDDDQDVDDDDDDDEDVDDDKVLPAWWLCTKLPWPLFPTFEVLQTSNSSSSLSPIIIMIILFITAGEIRP